MSHEIRFRIKDAGHDTPCWLWAGTVKSHGYGQAGRSARAHRYVYEQLVGPIPDGMVLDHLCCRKTCVNPEHLEAVSQRENVLRIIERGRRPTPPWVPEARRLREQEGAGVREIGRRLNVPASCVSVQLRKAVAA